MQELNCPLCGKDSRQEGFCKLHAQANENLLKKYDRWRTSREISWKEYLSEVAKNPLTGEWARQVARYLIDLENHKNVKNS